MQQIILPRPASRVSFLQNVLLFVNLSVSPLPCLSLTVKYLQDLSLSPTALGSTQSLSPYVTCSLNPSVEVEAEARHNLSLPGPFQRVRRGSDGSIYNQLQFPSTSNHGSMKRKKRSERSPDTTSSSLSQSPASASAEYRESEYYDNNVKIWSLEYVPRSFTITKKTVKV